MAWAGVKIAKDGGASTRQTAANRVLRCIFFCSFPLDAHRAKGYLAAPREEMDGAANVAVSDEAGTCWYLPRLGVGDLARATFGRGSEERKSKT